MILEVLVFLYKLQFVVFTVTVKCFLNLILYQLTSLLISIQLVITMYATYTQLTIDNFTSKDIYSSTQST